MAFIVITADTDEIEHRELSGTLTIGRSPECDVSIRDVLLSRKHCRFEPAGEGEDAWVVVDLESKNKTKVNGQPVERHLLDDGDIVRVGKTRMLFNAGVFTAPSNDSKRRRIRPADPHEALAGTVAGFELLEPGSTPRTDFFPTPQPSPRRPRAYAEENVESLLSGIASSSWDSIVTGVRAQTRTVRASPKPVMREVDVMRVLESDEETSADEVTTIDEPELIMRERVETSNARVEFDDAPAELDDAQVTDDAPRALTKLELAANQLRADASALDEVAVDALHALSTAVAEVRAEQIARLHEQAGEPLTDVAAERSNEVALEPVNDAGCEPSTEVALEQMVEVMATVVGDPNAVAGESTAEVRVVKSSRAGAVLRWFEPTEGSVGLRLVVGMLAAAGAIVVGGGVLIYSSGW